MRGMLPDKLGLRGTNSSAFDYSGFFIPLEPAA
jgi:hypothetical protein